MNNKQKKGLTLIIGGVLLFFVIPFILRAINNYDVFIFFYEYHARNIGSLILIGIGLKYLIPNNVINSFSQKSSSNSNRKATQYLINKNFRPYGGRFFSKKTGIDYFDKIIDNGYHLNFKENWIETKNAIKLIWLRFLLWFISIAVVNFFLTIFVGVIFFTSNSSYRSSTDVEAAFIMASLLMIIIIPFAIVNIFKGLKSLFKIQTKHAYFKILWEILLGQIIFIPIYFIVVKGFSPLTLRLYDTVPVLGLIIGLYLSISYAFAIPTLLTTGLGVWESMEISRKVVTRNWTNIATHLLISFLIMLSGGLVFGIGTIFTIPLGISYYFVIFIKVFNPQTQDSNDE